MVPAALLAALPLVTLAQAKVIEHWWNISYAQANPDQLQERRVIGINGSWPPPILYGTQGDVHLIHATNGLEPGIPTALHAHGMFFNGTNYFDGATGVTQCGIPYGQTFDYQIDTSLNQGTFWIHGHYNGQYVDGLRSPNIVLPAKNRTDNVTWDEEYHITVGDWYHDQHQYLLDNEFLTWTNPTGAEPVPKSAAIFVGKGDKYLHTNEEISAGVGVNDNAYIPFEANKTYRLRIINMAALAMWYIAIDSHDMYIIETDGVEVEPYKIDVLTISVAQRYSVLVKAKNETNKNYAMMFMQSEDMYDVVPEDLILNNTVQIRYNQANENATAVIYEAVPLVNDTEYIPVDKEPSVTPDVEYTLHTFFDTYDDGTNRASFTLEDGFQNSTFRPPITPSMFTALSMGKDAMNTAIYGHQTNVLAFKHLDMVQLTVFNWDAGFHPFHLHGHHFQVIEKSFDVTSDDKVINPDTVDLQANPARRDTITIPPSGKVVIRFRADNPGAWFFHCHIDWHLSSGLAAVFLEAPEVMQERIKPPQFMYDHCKAANIPSSGNVVGLMSTTDFKGQPYGPFPLKMDWTPKAIGALAGCIITFLVGVATIVWYGHGDLSEEELEEEVRRSIEHKQNKVPVWKKAFSSNRT